MTILRSLGIVSASRIVGFLFSLATVVVVSRLLTPTEIGIFSVSAGAIALGHVFRDFGVAQFLIQTPEVTRHRRRAAFTVTLVFSWTIAGAMVLLHRAAADFYGNRGVGEVMLLLSVNFLSLPFGAPLRALLQREMHFGKLAAVDLTYGVIHSGTTIAAALLGASYLSMALGAIAGNIANVVMLAWLVPGRAFEWPTLRGLREVLAFGSKASTASLAGSAGDAAPDLILGRTLGFAEVAFFSRGRSLIAMALEQILVVARSVFAPSFAKDFRQGKDPATVYSATMSLLLGITVPVIALLAALAPDLILWLFGPQWTRSAPLGTAFCLFALLTAPYALASTALVAHGQVGAMMRCRLAVEGLRIAVLLGSIWMPLEPVVYALAATYLLEAVLFGRALRKHTGLTTSTLARVSWQSYALVPFVLAGPLAVKLLATTSTWSTVTSLVLCLISAVGGWLLALGALKHPLGAELRRTYLKLRADLR